MIRGRNIKARAWRMPAGVPFAVLLALAPVAHAPVAHAVPPGSVSDYKLPPGPTAAPPPVQGPVDPDVPSTRPTRPPSPPAAQPAPPSTSEPPRVVLPSFAPAATPAQRQRQQRTAPAAQATQTALPTESRTEAVQPAAEASPAPLPLPAPEPLAPSATSSRPDWLWIALAALGVLLALAGVVWMLRRRKTSGNAAETPVEETEPEGAGTASAPASLPPVRLSATPPSPDPAQPDLPPASPVAHPEPRDTGLEVRLEASQLSRSLVYATLAYRLTLTNRSAAAIAPARVLADLISAHASLAAEEQLSPDATALHLKHDVPSLTPDEPVSLSGELRIAVATIRPIMQGGAALFVPLARFRIETADGGASDHVFVVGQPADQPGGALKPLRIDGLPGVVRPLDQRRVMANAA